MHGRKPLRKMERAYRTRNAFYGSPFLLPEVCLVRCISDRKQFSDRILKINFFFETFCPSVRSNSQKRRERRMFS